MTEMLDKKAIEKLFGLTERRQYDSLIRRQDFPKHKKIVKRGQARCKLFDAREVQEFKQRAKFRTRRIQPVNHSFNEMAFDFLNRPQPSGAKSASR